MVARPAHQHIRDGPTATAWSLAALFWHAGWRIQVLEALDDGMDSQRRRVPRSRRRLSNDAADPAANSALRAASGTVATRAPRRRARRSAPRARTRCIRLAGA